MKYYIKRTFFTLWEALFLTGFLYFLENYILENHPLTNFFQENLLKILPELSPSLNPALRPFVFLWGSIFVFALLFLFFLRFLWHRFTLWRILHFSIRRVDEMSGIEFENFLKLRFERLGFSAETTKTSNDYGADLILQKKNLKIAVQAKRYRGTIGVKAVQEVIGSMAYYKAEKGLVVTNSVFTKNAENLASANDVILWDRDVLVRLLSGEPMTGYINELTEM